MILIESNCSRTSNLGDEAILSYNLKLLKNTKINEVIVISPLPKVTSTLHRVKCIPSFYVLIDGNNRRTRNLRALWLAFKLLFNAWRVKRAKNPILLKPIELKFLHAFHKCKAFLIVGGGIMRSSACFFSSNASGLFPKCIEILIAKIFGKPVFVGAQTIGPFEIGNLCSLWGKMLTRFALNKVDVLTVREHYSKRLLQKIGVKGNIKVVVDEAFNAETVDSERAEKLLYAENLDIKKLRREGKLVVGVSLRAWTMVNERKTLRKKLLKVLETLSKDRQHHFVFIPTHASRHLPRIIKVVEKVVTSRVEPERCTFISNPYTWQEIKSFFGLMDAVIAVSFHSAVFSLSTNIPTLGLYEGEYYHMKMKGLFNLVGLSNFALDASTEKAEKILSKFKELIMRKEEIKKFLIEKKPILQRSCGYAVKKLIEHLAEGKKEEADE